MTIILGAGSTSNSVAPVAGFEFAATISASTNNYDIRVAALAGGWDGVEALFATITINAAVIVGSTSSSTPALQTNAVATSFPGGSTLAIINNGTILGKGGDGGDGGQATATGSSHSAGNGTNGTAGGDGLYARYAVSINNNSIVGGGGGGGAGGGGCAFHTGSTGNAMSGNGAGGGQGQTGGALGVVGSVTDTVTDLWTYNGTSVNGTAGTATGKGLGENLARNVLNFELTSSSFKSSWIQKARGGGGGNGGIWGATGSVSAFTPNDSDPLYTWTTASNGSAGAAGYYSVGDSAYVTWSTTGTRHGSASG